MWGWRKGGFLGPKQPHSRVGFAHGEARRTSGWFPSPQTSFFPPCGPAGVWAGAWRPDLALNFLPLPFADDNIDETYGVNVQFESDEEVGDEGPEGGSGVPALSPCPVLFGDVGRQLLTLTGRRRRIIQVPLRSLGRICRSSS